MYYENKDRNRQRDREDSEYRQAKRAERLEGWLVTALALLVALALGVSLYGLVWHLLFPLIEAMGGGR